MTEHNADHVAETVIEVDELVKRYGERTVVDGVSLVVQRGEVFGLLGPNGAGKTTTVETVVGLRTPTGGRVRVLGRDPVRDHRQLAELVTVQPQAAALFPTLTVRETMRLFASFYGAPRDAESVIDEIGLRDAARTRVKHLSGGQERRLLIGIALVGNPEVLLLDEPSAGLDPSARRNLWEIIERQRDRGTTVLLTTHHMEEATQVCDRLAIMVDGRIAASGTPDALVQEFSKTVTVTFGVPGVVSVADLTALEIPGEISVAASGQGTRVTVVTEDPDSVLRRVTFTPGLRASGYQVRHGSLEDVFLEVSDRGSAPPSEVAA